MNFELRPIDITKFKCDAIVNSLGTLESVKVFGKLCSNIVKGAGSELKEEIFSWEKDALPGRMFITSGYKLPCSNIIHFVTPYFDKDPEMYALEYIYKQTLIICYARGWKNIALPIIGTGANGYPHAYVLKMLTSLVKAFTELYKQVKVTICVPVVSKEEYESSFDVEKLEKNIINYFKKNSHIQMREFEYNKYSFAYQDYNFEEVYDIQPIHEYKLRESYEGSRYEERYNRVLKNKIPFVDEKELLLESGNRPVKFDMNSIGLFSVTNYVETYIETRYSNESDRKIIRKHVNQIVSGDTDSTSLKAKHNNEDKRTTISLSMLMRYILALHMTRQEADDLLLFCGRIFSPVGKEDIVYTNIIKLKKYDVHLVNGLCAAQHINPIFGYSDK